MDINTIRTVTTVVSFVLFIGIMVWTFSRRRAEDFKDAANLPFEQD
jgi:cytochrome c oxidase cbb3-type subunit 4